MCLSWAYTKFLHTVPKSHEMEMRIFVNNHHMITHLTLADVTFTYRKCITLLYLSWHDPLVWHKICSYDIMYNVNPSSNMKIHNTYHISFCCITWYYNITVMVAMFCMWHDTCYVQMWLSDITNESQNYSLPILAYTIYENLPTISQYVTW